MTFFEARNIGPVANIAEALAGFDVEGYGMTSRLQDAGGNPRAARMRYSRVVGSPLPSSLKAGSLIGDIPVHKGMSYLQQVCPLSLLAPVGNGVGIP